MEQWSALSPSLEEEEEERGSFLIFIFLLLPQPARCRGALTNIFNCCLLLSAYLPHVIPRFFIYLPLGVIGFHLRPLRIFP